MLKNILFFSVNRHQKQYFDQLVSSIENTDASFSIHKRQLFSVFPSLYIDKEELSLIKEVNAIRKAYDKNKTGRNPTTIKYFFQFISTLFFLLKIKRLVSIRKYDLVILWNDMKWHQIIIKEIAKKEGIKTAFFENGALPNTVTFDFKGVNFNNSVPRERDYYESKTQEYVDDKCEELSVSNNEEKYIFVPFQVDYDTQIISHSPWIEDMNYLYQVLQRLSKTLPDNIKIIIKEHPASSRSYQHLHDIDSRIRFENNMDTSLLISNSEMVITINSTVGLESIVKNKPVIALGNAFYGIDGICMTARNEAELLDKIQSYTPANKAISQSFLKYLSEEYYIPGNWRSPTQEHVNAIKNRIYEVLD
jgi:capsular polysaccharide export protein